MRIRYKLLMAGLAATTVISVITAAAMQGDFVVLDAQGTIAAQQRQLMIWVVALMALIVIPVFWLTAHIAWKYRADNHKATYTPEWDHNRRLETIWWGFPALIILILSIIIWSTSHGLDPSRPIATTSAQPPLKIQVVAMQWKWLFIYPEQDIATINYVKIPANRPVHFEITADAPMNSFWIPQLGGQMYAMSGMRTNLHLMADKPGEYQGTSANLSGAGFAGMRFHVSALNDVGFDAWVDSSRNSPGTLDLSTYEQLAAPSFLTSTGTYQLANSGLQDIIIGKYAQHHNQPDSQTGSQHDGQTHSTPGQDKELEGIFDAITY